MVALEAEPGEQRLTLRPRSGRRAHAAGHHSVQAGARVRPRIPRRRPGRRTGSAARGGVRQADLQARAIPVEIADDGGVGVRQGARRPRRGAAGFVRGSRAAPAPRSGGQYRLCRCAATTRAVPARAAPTAPLPSVRPTAHGESSRGERRRVGAAGFLRVFRERGSGAGALPALLSSVSTTRPEYSPPVASSHRPREPGSAWNRTAPIAPRPPGRRPAPHHGVEAQRLQPVPQVSSIPDPEGLATPDGARRPARGRAAGRPGTTPRRGPRRARRPGGEPPSPRAWREARRSEPERPRSRRPAAAGRC